MKQERRATQMQEARPCKAVQNLHEAAHSGASAQDGKEPHTVPAADVQAQGEEDDMAIADAVEATTALDTPEPAVDRGWEKYTRRGGFTVTDLKGLCKSLGLRTTGRKEDIARRIAAFQNRRQ